MEPLGPLVWLKRLMRLYQMGKSREKNRLPPSRISAKSARGWRYKDNGTHMQNRNESIYPIPTKNVKHFGVCFTFGKGRTSLKVNSSGDKKVRASRLEGSPRRLSPTENRIVMAGMSPKGSTDRLTHVRVVRFLCKIWV